MAEEDFLRRWSRLKRGASPPAPAPEAAAPPPAPELPPLDSLTFESDFKDFMHSKVEESVKRAALKKLFSDPRFNVIDPLDIDIDDYSNLERIPEETAKALLHAKRTLFGPPAEAPEATPPRQTEAGETEAEENGKPDGDTRQDA